MWLDWSQPHQASEFSTEDMKPLFRLIFSAVIISCSLRAYLTFTRVSKKIGNRFKHSCEMNGWERNITGRKESWKPWDIMKITNGVRRKVSYSGLRMTSADPWLLDITWKIPYVCTCVYFSKKFTLQAFKSLKPFLLPQIEAKRGFSLNSLVSRLKLCFVSHKWRHLCMVCV